MKTEPILSTAGITAGVTAILALLVAFGIPLTDEQRVAILGVAAVAAPLVVIVARRYVTPNAHVVEGVQDGSVIAGEASELPTGTVVRTAGTLDLPLVDLDAAEADAVHGRRRALTDADVTATHAPVDNA